MSQSRLIALCVVLLGTCPPSFAQAQTPPATALLVNARSGMCVSVRDASASPTEPTVQGDCVDAAHQQWRLQPVAGAYRAVNVNSGQCLDVAGASQADGAAITQYPCGDLANQRFALQKAGEHVRIVAVASGKCVTVANSSIDAGSAIVQRACIDEREQTWTLSGPAAPSKWTAKLPLPIVPVAAATLRNGKVLTWSAYDRFNYTSEDQGKTYTSIFNPQTGKATERLVSNTGHDMFCPGTATLPDGRILVNGGSSAAKTSIYDPATNRWTSGPAMNVPRGYQGDTVLSTGEVLTIGGSFSGGVGGKIGEVWSSGGGWRRLRNVVTPPLEGPDPRGDYRGDNHMWLFASGDGDAFHAGPSAAMHWISTAGRGSIESAGTRAGDEYSMNGNVVMYDAGRLLKIGGAPAYENVLANSTAVRIDFSKGRSKPVKVKAEAPMAFPRAFANAVVAPTGEVIVLGGQTYAAPFDDRRSILIPEIWSPQTRGFRRLAPMATPRNYHSVATLLLDGRVLVGGGGLCGGCWTNHPDVEILTPPYLLKDDGSPASRPVITSAPSSAGLRARIEVSTDRPVASFAIIRMSAATHSLNNDQRRIALPIKAVDGGVYRLRLPPNPGVLLRGDWMLFAIDDKGVPSLASILRVQ